MWFYIVLLSFTIVIIYLAWKLFAKTKDISFPVGIALFYYWSLAGSWFFIFDKLTNQKGKDFGLHYYYLLEKLFNISLDSSYLATISLYGLFIIIIEIILLKYIKPGFRQLKFEQPLLKFHHAIPFIISIICIIISFTIIFSDIRFAIENNYSIYTITRASQSNLFGIHRLFNEYAILAPLIGFILIISRKENKIFFCKKSYLLIFLYFINIWIVECYLILLGNKQELLYAGLFAMFFYLIIVKFQIKVKNIIIILLIVVIPISLTDTIRSFKPKQIEASIHTTNSLNSKTHSIQQKNDAMNLVNVKTAYAFLFSNEMFSAHFSMYGAIYFKVPMTYGTSFVSLGASLVPKIIWSDRPAGIYEYYAKSVKAKEGQGYAIHHATAWYLNFGLIGLILGAVLIGFLWTYSYNLLRKTNNKLNLPKKIIYLISNICLVAYIPVIVRVGPECYKPLFFDAYLTPFIIIYLSCINYHILINRIFKNKTQINNLETQGK